MELSLFERNFLGHREAVNSALSSLRPFSLAPTLQNCIEHVLFPGGKRLRPVLALLAGEAFGERSEGLLGVAAAVELLHTASLVFDDLPAMDNADSRRGKRALHTLYTPDMAVLCGHSLVSLAIHLLTKTALSDGAVRRILAELSRSIGPFGMAAGQADDLAGLQGMGDTQADRVAAWKTGYLFAAAAYCGAAASEADEGHAYALREFGLHLGTAYQIADDLRDQGKEDARDRTVNIAMALGERAAREAYDVRIEWAREGLARIPKATALLDLVDAIDEGCHVRNRRWSRP